MFGGLNTLNSLHNVEKFLKKFKKNKFTKIIYCPPYTLIRPMSKNFKNLKLKLALKTVMKQKFQVHLQDQ